MQKQSILNVFSAKTAFQNLPLKLEVGLIWNFFLQIPFYNPYKKESRNLFFHVIFQKVPIVIFLALKITQICVQKNLPEVFLNFLKIKKIQHALGAEKKIFGTNRVKEEHTFGVAES